jgi:rod shape determining protein RodA
MFERIRPYLGWTSWPIIAAMLVLMGLSLVAVGAAERADPSLGSYAARQAVYAVVCLVAFFAATLVHYQRIGRTAYLWLLVNLALLVVVLFLPPIRNSHRWINLRLFQVQPSELAKLTYILALAWYLRYRDNYRSFPGLIPPFVLTLIPAGLILIEPDLGTTLLLFPTLFFMLFMAGAKLKHLLTVLAAVLAVMFFPVPQGLSGLGPAEVAERKSLAYWHGRIGQKEYALRAAPLLKMEHHQLTRIKGWLRQSNPAAAEEEGYQLRQSKMILGAGGLGGHGKLEELGLCFRMLPDDHTDFIYAVIGGQWGFAGCALVMLVYLVIFVCGAEIASLTHDPFGRLLVIGVLALLFSQIFINAGMTMGLMPITGMTLPLISYGGSSMFVNAVALGLLVNVGLHRPILLGRKPFEYRERQARGQVDYGPLFAGVGPAGRRGRG